MNETFRRGIIEALIFASPRPISPGEIIRFSGIESKKEIEKIVEDLNGIYEENHRAFRIKKIAGGYQFFTINSYAPYISEMFQDRHKFRLTRAMLEVLSIVSVKQPVTKPVIDKIRNADSGAPVHSLLEAGLITVKGRQKSPGKPFIYGTTEEFLRIFGLESLSDIPDEDEIKQLFEERAKEEIEKENVFPDPEKRELNFELEDENDNNPEEPDGEEA